MPNQSSETPTEARRSGFFAWVGTILVWFVAIVLVIIVAITVGRSLGIGVVSDGVPAGKLVRSLGAHPFSSRDTGHVKLIPWLEAQVLGFTGMIYEWNPVEALAFRDDNLRLVSLSPSEMILWNLEDGSVEARVRNSDYMLSIHHLLFYAGGSRIALFSDLESIQIFDGQTLSPLAALPRSGDVLETARTDAAGNLWYVVAGDRQLTIRRISGLIDATVARYPISPFDLDGSLNAPPRPVLFRLDPDRKRLALRYNGGAQKILGWDAQSNLSEITAPDENDYFAGSVVEEEAFESTTALVRSRVIAPRIDLARLEHTATFTSATVSADGRLIATGSQDMLVRIWQAPAR
ncbi:MAG: WD40 domain-containing protein [bacterium]|nr:WD40 domain-containing protein [bacterium]